MEVLDLFDFNVRLYYIYYFLLLVGIVDRNINSDYYI